jgi:hypothetical protein
MNTKEESAELDQYKSLVGGRIVGVVWDNVELENEKLYGLKIEMPNGDTRLAWPLGNSGKDKGTLEIDNIEKDSSN